MEHDTLKIESTKDGHYIVYANGISRSFDSLKEGIEWAETVLYGNSANQNYNS